MGHCVLLATTFNLREGHKLQFSASVGLSHPAAEMWVHGQSWQPHTDTQGREMWTLRVKEVWRWWRSRNQSVALRGRSRGGAGQGAVWVPELRLRSTQGEQGWESQGMGRRECEGLWLGRGAGRMSRVC